MTEPALVSRVSLLVESPSWTSDLDALGGVLGEPQILQSGVWAQFEASGTRVSLAPGERARLVAMVKVADLAAAVGALRTLGWSCSAERQGAHESMVDAVTPGGATFTVYAPLNADPASSPPESAERPEPSTVEIPPDEFRSALSHFGTGIVVISGHDEVGPVGFTCQSFSALSLDPPLVLFCPSRTSTSWPRIKASGRCTVNVLGSHQAELSARFARSGGPKFDAVAWATGETGSPRLAEAIAHVDCRIESVSDGGDHEVAIARVVALDWVRSGGEPLLYYRSAYGTFR